MMAAIGTASRPAASAFRSHGRKAALIRPVTRSISMPGAVLKSRSMAFW